MTKPFFGMPMYEKKIEDIEFHAECGQAWKLKFEKTEYRAYVYVYGGWKPMYLGSADPDSLREYIVRTYRKEVK